MNLEKRQKIYRSIMLVILSVLITFITTTVVLYKYLKADGNIKYILVSDNDSSIGAEISKLRTIIDQYYLGEIDDEKLKEGAISGYINALGDEYTAYITKEEYDEFQANIMGNYVGIGIYMSVYKNSDEIVIIAPIKNSPAEKSGLKSGDIITKVNGIEYSGVDGMEIASDQIKGEEGTTVDIEIKRNEEILNFTITREKVIMNPITAEVLENNIGYIQLISFDENCSQEFKEKYEELQIKGIKSLIIDLRNNGGGIVQEALTIADYIVPKYKTLMVTVNKTENEVTEIAEQEPIITMPVIVLVNENSASASEILVGALKENGCAKIVGTKTFGKGVIQEILKLADGSALKLTTEEYFTPNRNKINGVGIEPDVIVELPEDVLPSYSIERTKDTQLNKAIELLKEE